MQEAFDSGAQWVSIDFADCTFCDSSCMKLLLSARRQARALGRGFAVLHPPPMLRRMGELLGASDFLELPGF